MDEGSGKRESLLFSAGEDIFPACVSFIKPVEKMAQPYFLDCRTDRGLVDCVRRERIGHGTAQRSKRYVGLLGHQKQPLKVDPNFSPTPRPQAGDRPY